MLIDIIGGSYKNRYLAVNPSRTINWLPVTDLSGNEKNKYKMELFATPGLASFSDTTKTNLRAIFTARTLVEERCFVVADNFLYEISSAGTATSRGQMTNITNDATPCWMAVNGNRELIVVHGSASYILALGTNTLTQITDVDYPSTPTSLTYMDGYFIICAGGRIYYSNLNDGFSWTGSDVLTPTSKADNTLAAICWRDDIVAFGSETIETYINDGTPFIKAPRSTANIGLVDTNTLVAFHNGIVFLGKARGGEAAVYVYDGQQVLQISPFSVTWQINNLTPPISSSTGFVEYTKDGHWLYYLTIPALSTTYVYDFLTSEWHERQSYNPNTTNQAQFRGKYHTNFSGMNLFADIYTGKVLKEDYTIATENSNAITRTRISQVFAQEQKYLSIYSVQIDANTGTGLIATPSTAPNLAFSYSKDGGNTFGTATNLGLGASGSYNVRAKFNKLGTARNWAIKLVVTDAADVMIQQAIVNGVLGVF